MKVLPQLLTVLLLAAPAAAQMKTMNGAGATFPYPIYSKWFDEYHKVKPELQINYQAASVRSRSAPSTSAPPTDR
jgi:phosphate transport system substrate-binding protein